MGISTRDTSAISHRDPLAGISVGSADWLKVGRALPDLFAQAPIHLIPSTQAPTPESLERLFPNAKRIFAVDFCVEGAERGAALESGAGYKIGERIYNIDHHAPDERWERHVSSGNLACLWVKAHGPIQARDGDIVVVNHTDCDSVLASLIITGSLPPHARFEQAVLDADHRGIPHDIADLLQSCSRSRDLPRLVGALSMLLQGMPLPLDAQLQIERLNAKRQQVREMARTGSVTSNDGVVLLRSDRCLDSDLLLPVFPEAKVLVVACCSDIYPDLRVTRLRLGAGVEGGISLHRIGLSELDPFYGGRFNAGSNKRGLEYQVGAGATPKVVPSDAYFEHLVNRLSKGPTS